MKFITLLRQKTYYIPTGLLLLVLLISLSFYLLNIHEQNDQQESTKKDAVSSKTLSPNNPIAKKNVGEYMNQEPIRIQSSIKAEKFVPKILFYRASIPYWDQEAAFNSFKQNVSLFNYVTVFWYTLRSNGSIRKYIYANEDKKIINFAHKNSVKVFGLIANLPDEDEGGSWDRQRVGKVTNSSVSRNAHINEIVELTQRMNFDGISIDYEELAISQKNDFTLFIQELAAALHKKGKLLGVAIHPKSGEGKPSEDNGSAAQDLLPLSLAADHLYFMTYGQHWDDSAAGPIASLSWVRSVINYALEIGVRRKKIFVGIPLYGLNWPKNGPSYGTANGFTFSEVNSLISTYKPKIVTDTIEGSAHFTYKSGGQTHEVWFENYQTVAPKLEFAKSLGISATFWRLGGEDNRIWPTLNNFR